MNVINDIHSRWIAKRNRVPDESDRSYNEKLAWDQCGICKFWFPLARPLGADWGACTNPASPFDRTVMFEHDGCDHFVEAPEGWRTPEGWQ